MTEVINYRQAIARAIADEMEADPNIIFFGEDVAAAGGAFKSTVGLYERFGGRRVRDTPISEQAIVGAALGAALMGVRPVAEIMFADFAGVCFDQIANQVAKYRYMTNGQAKVPLTIRMANGAGAGFGAQHSQSSENWFLNVPGLKIVVPGTVEDLYGLLRSAIQDDNPVLVYEHKNLFGLKGSISDDQPLVEIGKAKVARVGTDVTVVATQQMLHRSLEAAEMLSSEGIRAEVIDPRTLVPFDEASVVASLEKTSRLLVVQESPSAGSWGASLISQVAVNHFYLLDTAPRLLGSPNTPVPYAEVLEEAWLPSVERIAQEIRDIVKE